MSEIVYTRDTIREWRTRVAADNPMDTVMQAHKSKSVLSGVALNRTGGYASPKCRGVQGQRPTRRFYACEGIMKEKMLEAWILEHLAYTWDMLHWYRDSYDPQNINPKLLGSQVRLEHGIADIILTENGKNFIVELKARRVKPGDIAQVLRYVGDVRRLYPMAVIGWLIGPWPIDANTIWAAKEASIRTGIWEPDVKGFLAFMEVTYMTEDEIDVLST